MHDLLKIRDGEVERLRAIMDVREEFKKESDRGCCLMAAAFLEHELQELLKSKLVGSKKTHEALFEFNGPLGTFSSKIKLAFAVGIIGKQEVNDLEIIRKIRNDFGHKHQAINFETKEFKDRIDNFQSSIYDKGSVEYRAVFINTVAALLGQFASSSFTVAKFEERVSLVLTSEDKKELRNIAEEFADRADEILEKLKDDKEAKK